MIDELPGAKSRRLLEGLPQDLKALLDESIIPSPHSIALKRSPESDFQRRHVRRKPHVAELYQENSKIHPHSPFHPQGNEDRLKQIREWFFETSYNMKEEEYLDHESENLRVLLDEVDPDVREVLEPFSTPGDTTNLLFSADLLVLQGEHLTRFVPESRHLWTERKVSPPEINGLRAKLGKSAEEWQRTKAVFFLVACPWRRMILWGPRGYRHTLLDVGRLLAHFEQHVPTTGLEAAVHQDFHDSAIDRFLLADGVERSTYAILTLSAPEK
ncbi:MAG: hypothetical protein GVY23_01960 [Spirochaetes bacterium]|jgi:hypothetical protein|nr:hypothetical protein [Spirochaetota bacterium]